MRIEKAIEKGFTHSGHLLFIPVYFKIENDNFIAVLGKGFISKRILFLLIIINRSLPFGLFFNSKTDDLSLEEQLACSKENRDVKVI